MPTETLSRQHVYAAEHALDAAMTTEGAMEVHGSTIVLPPAITFSEVEHIEAYLGRVVHFVNSDLGTKYTVPSLQLGRRNLRRKAYYQSGTITLPQRESGKWAWSVTTVLHELAHHLTVGHGHDEVFTGMLTYLYEICVGPEAAFVYSRLLMERGMTPIQPTKRKVSA